MQPIPDEQIATRFAFHPATPTTIPMHEEIRVNFKDIALEMNRLLPESREKSLCLTALQEASQWANAAVAINLAPEEER